MTASRDVSVLPSAEWPQLRAAIEPWTVAPTAAELGAGALDAGNLDRAVEGLAKDGVVVLKGVVDTEHARLMRDRVLSDIAKYETDAATEKIEQGGVGWWHNWQGGRPPPIHPYLFDDFCYNEFVIQVISAAIKDAMPPDWDGALAGSYGLINMAYRGDMVQEVHTDGGSAPLDPSATLDDLPGARPTGFSVNFPVTPQTVDSGATEYWAGTHRDLGLKRGRADPAGRFATEAMREEYEAEHGPPKRTFGEPGDVFIRNTMVWHRGVANYSNTHRPMISIGYSGDNDSSDRHGFGGDGTRRGQGFSAPRNTATFWCKHPKMSFTPVLIDDDKWTDAYYQLEQRYHGPRYIEELDCYLPGHIGKNGHGPYGVMLDPVTTLAGVTYERTEIEATLSGNGYIDPTCNIRVMSKLIPNKEVKRQGEQWLADRTISRM